MKNYTLEQRIAAGKTLARLMPGGYGLTTTDLEAIAEKHNNNLINGAFDIYPLAFKDGAEWEQSNPRRPISDNDAYKDAAIELSAETHGADLEKLASIYAKHGNDLDYYSRNALDNNIYGWEKELHATAFLRADITNEVMRQHGYKYIQVSDYEHEWRHEGRQKPRMTIIKTYKDATHGNTATIEQGQTLAYMGANDTAPAFRLTLSADYESDFVYFVAVYETLEEAVSRLADFGGAEHWHEV